MKFFIYLTVISFIGCVLLLIKAIRDEKEKEIDESSPENIEIDKTLKILLLRKKLEQIEESINLKNEE